MGKRKGVEANTDMDKNENENRATSMSTSCSAMEMSQGQSLTTGNKIEGGENENKKTKRDESSNSSTEEVEAEAGQSKSQESIIKEISTDNFPPENVNVNANDQPSTSSSYLAGSGKEASTPKLQELDLTRKQEVDEAADEEFTEGPINKLPPEMLTKILKCVDTRSLFKCRFVSHQLLEISSQILTERTRLVFKFRERFQEFMECMTKYKDVPYTRFSFHFESPSFFESRDWLEFLSVFALSNPNPNPNQRATIKYLHLKCNNIPDTEALLLFTEQVRDLLLNKIPHLQEFCLEFSSSSNDSENIKLFPLPENTESESEPTTTTTITASAAATVPILLPYLKVLVIDQDMFLHFPGIVSDLLDAAVNVTRIGVPNDDFYQQESPTNIFEFLHSHGKLHLLKNVLINVDAHFLTDVKRCMQGQQHSNFVLGFKVEELILWGFFRDIGETLHADATSFISNLLESSKDTLEKLEIPPLGVFHGLQIPKFPKLKTLKVVKVHDENQPLFPPGIRSREIFPLVEFLKLESTVWEDTFPQEDSIPSFPSVHTLLITDPIFTESTIPQLGLMCPNLKHLTVKKEEYSKLDPDAFNFAQVGRSIWTHLKQLESLEVDIDAYLLNHHLPQLDSCFTGISKTNCYGLYDLMKAEKKLKKRKSQVKLSESEELKTLTIRKYPSILDMTNLKKLTIHKYAGRSRRGELLTPKITWVSKEYAFKLMPQLQLKITMEDDTSED